MNSARLNEPVEMIPTRQSLLSRLKNCDDHESWKVFFDTYWRLIYNAAVRAGLSDAEAQDVVQETIISVSKQMPSFQYDPEGSFKAWLLRLTSWRVKDQFWKRQPGIQSHKAEASTSTSTATVEGVADPAGLALEALWDEEWERNLMAVALERVRRQVNPKQYQIFDCHVLMGWPVLRVARALKVRTALVYLTKHRITRLIKKEVARLRTKPIEITRLPQVNQQT